MRLFKVTKRDGRRKIYLADYMHVDINCILRLYERRDGDDAPRSDDFLVFAASRDAWNDCEDRGEV